MTIAFLLGCGFAAGLLVGAVADRPKVGCHFLLVVPVAMITYIGWWQGENPVRLRSTSALDFLFGPLWPSLGALAGYLAGVQLRSYCKKR